MTSPSSFAHRFSTADRPGWLNPTLYWGSIRYVLLDVRVDFGTISIGGHIGHSNVAEGYYPFFRVPAGSS